MLLVTRATGHIGRELVRELDEGAAFRVLVRDPARAAGLPERAERVVGYLQPAMLAPALDGVERLFLLVPGIGVEHTEHAIAAAEAAGVRRIVYLSSYAVIGDPIPAMGRWHHEREQLIRVCGIPATFLRPCGFMTNAFDWVPTLREGGYVLDPAGAGRAAPVDPADIAAVAAVTLTDDGHEGDAVPADRRRGVHRRGAGPDPGQGDRSRHRSPDGGHAGRGGPVPLPSRGAAGARRRPHRRTHADAR